jgi:hypothetical protein
MKVLCILQNQWANNPDQINALHAKHPGMRNEIISRMLFRGSLTGSRIEAVFGDMMKNHAFIFDEASASVVSNNQYNAPYNASHVRETIARLRPDAVIAFGSSPRRAIEDVRKAKREKIDLPPVIECVHPAIQKPGWMQQMLDAKSALKAIFKQLQPV